MEVLKNNDTVLKGKVVKVLDEKGNMLGMMPFDIAFQKAEYSGLNLILVNKDCIPPICKCINYGKHVYEQNKKKKENQKTNNVKTKEIELTYKIASNDLETKINKILECVSKGHNVKVKMCFKKREEMNVSMGMEIMQSIMERVKTKYPTSKQSITKDVGEIKIIIE